MFSRAELLQVRPLEGEEAKSYQEKVAVEFPKGVCRVGPFGYVADTSRVPQFHEFLDFQVRPDDAWIMGFPRSGTTWLQEIVWIIINNFDFETARKVHNQKRIPCLSHVKGRDVPNYSTDLEELPSPRCLKSHNPRHLLPEQYHTMKPKTLFIHRDPREVCVSYFYLHVCVKGYQGTLDEFVDSFIADVVQHTPYFEWLKGFWEIRKDPNMLILTYKEMKTDLKSTIQKIAKFLGNTVTSEQSKMLEDHVEFSNVKGKEFYDINKSDKHFEKMYKAPWTNHFVRKGEVDGWKTELSESSIQKLNKWIEENGGDLVGDWL